MSQKDSVGDSIIWQSSQSANPALDRLLLEAKGSANVVRRSPRLTTPRRNGGGPMVVDGDSPLASSSGSSRLSTATSSSTSTFGTYSSSASFDSSTCGPPTTVPKRAPYPRRAPGTAASTATAHSASAKPQVLSSTLRDSKVPDEATFMSLLQGASQKLETQEKLAKVEKRRSLRSDEGRTEPGNGAQTERSRGRDSRRSRGIGASASLPSTKHALTPSRTSRAKGKTAVRSLDLSHTLSTDTDVDMGAPSDASCGMVVDSIHVDNSGMRFSTRSTRSSLGDGRGVRPSSSSEVMPPPPVPPDKHRRPRQEPVQRHMRASNSTTEGRNTVEKEMAPPPPPHIPRHAPQLSSSSGHKPAKLTPPPISSAGRGRSEPTPSPTAVQPQAQPKPPSSSSAPTPRGGPPLLGMRRPVSTSSSFSYGRGGAQAAFKVPLPKPPPPSAHAPPSKTPVSAPHIKSELRKTGAIPVVLGAPARSDSDTTAVEDGVNASDAQGSTDATEADSSYGDISIDADALEETMAQYD